MNLSLLSRHHRPKRDQITLFPEATLDHARVHECGGLSRHTFALLLAQKSGATKNAPIVWISLSHIRHHLNPQGMQPFVSPENFLFVTAKRPEDALWSMEEALRSPAPHLVVADIDMLPQLTPVRRLHLAAEQGHTTGLLLTPATNGMTGGAQGVETRWHMTPNHQPHDRGWTLARTRARTAIPKQWQITYTASGEIAPIATDQNDTQTSAIN